MRRELVKSMLSMVTPRLAGIGRPSFCQVMKTGWSPDITTQGMKTRCPIEKRGNSNGWMVGGTAGQMHRSSVLIIVSVKTPRKTSRELTLTDHYCCILILCDLGKHLAKQIHSDAVRVFNYG